MRRALSLLQAACMTLEVMFDLIQLPNMIVENQCTLRSSERQDCLEVECSRKQPHSGQRIDRSGLPWVRSQWCTTLAADDARQRALQACKRGGCGTAIPPKWDGSDGVDTVTALASPGSLTWRRRRIS